MISALIPIVFVAATARSWMQAVPVNIASDVTVAEVDSNYDFQTDSVGHGQTIYYYDCMKFHIVGDRPVKHIQVMFAAVNTDGEIKRKPLPVDDRYKKPADASSKLAVCRTWAYANGADGYWVVGWINVVDYADGTSWTAPPPDRLTQTFYDALPKE